MQSEQSTSLSPSQVQAEKSIRWVYSWLFWSVLFTVPWMGINNFNISSRSPLLASIWGALTPAILHLLLLTGLDKNNLFKRRHAQQAILLIMLRIASAVFFIGMLRSSGVCGWIFVNGILWIAGTVWGRNQVKRGDCWLMRIRGETLELPRPWVDEVSDQKDFAEKQRILEDPRTAFEEGKVLVIQGLKDEAIPYFTTAFRHGPTDLRRQAVSELKKLDEVERF